jgi:hypothetical protein
MSEHVLANKFNKLKKRLGFNRTLAGLWLTRIKVTRKETNFAKRCYLSEKFRFPPSEAATFNAENENKTKENKEGRLYTDNAVNLEDILQA